MNAVLKAIEERSSTRGYTDEKLTQEELDTLIRAGLQAPTAANRQEIHFTVMDGDNPLLAELQEAMLADRGAAEKPAHNFYYEAPTVMLISGDAANPWSSLDAGIAVENIALAAEGMGLGSLIIGCVKGALLGEKEAYFAKAFRFPEGYRYCIAVTKTPHTYDEAKSVTRL